MNVLQIEILFLHFEFTTKVFGRKFDVIHD